MCLQDLTLLVTRPDPFSEEEGCEFNYPMVIKMIDWGVDGIITDRPDILR